MSEVWKHGVPLSVLTGLMAGLILLPAVVAAEGPAVAEGPVASAEQGAASEEPATAADQEQPGEGRWSYLRPRFDASALRVHVDRQTGDLAVPPAKARLESALPAAFSSSHEGLEAVELPNGYTYVDARGRLFSAVSATLGKDGEVEVRHGLPAVPEGEPEAAESASADDGDRP